MTQPTAEERLEFKRAELRRAQTLSGELAGMTPERRGNGWDELRREIEALRALSDAATPGPWSIAHELGAYNSPMVTGPGIEDHVADLMHNRDADFIVAAVNYVRAVLAIVDRLAALVRTPETLDGWAELRREIEALRSRQVLPPHRQGYDLALDDVLAAMTRLAAPPAVRIPYVRADGQISDRQDHWQCGYDKGQSDFRDALDRIDAELRAHSPAALVRTPETLDVAGLRRIAWTPDKVERVLFLLERIAKELETARLRR